jgi:hypothetical protein
MPDATGGLNPRREGRSEAPRARARSRTSVPTGARAGHRDEIRPARLSAGIPEPAGRAAHDPRFATWFAMRL